MAVPAMEAMVEGWKKLEIAMPHLRPMIAPGRAKIEQYLSGMRNSKAYIIAMLLNPSCKFHWIATHWDTEATARARQWVHEEAVRYGAKPPSSPADTASPTKVTRAALMRGAMPSEEVRFYLSARRELVVIEDLLQWWERNRHRYPTLFRMVMDYLPIMASSVPCERVFSASAETDTPRRSRISPALMGALQVLKYALKKDRLDFSRQYVNHIEQLEAGDAATDRDAHTLTEMGYDVDENYLVAVFGNVHHVAA